MAIDCSICTSPFNDSDFKPVTGICGHSLCINCCRSLPYRKCPMCQRTYAFKDEIVNFQLIEHVLASKCEESENLARKTEYEALQKRHIKQTRELEELKKKMSKEEEEKKRLNLVQCSECGGLSAKMHIRICTTCCVSKGTVALKSGDSPVKILNLEQAEQVVICAPCALEGTHKGHHTVLFTKLKFKHQVEKIVAECDAVKTIGCSKELLNLHGARVQLLNSMKEASSSIERISSLDEFEKLLTESTDIKKQYESAIEMLEFQIQTSVNTITCLGIRLNSMNFPKEDAKKAVVEATPLVPLTLSLPSPSPAPNQRRSAAYHTTYDRSVGGRFALEVVFDSHFGGGGFDSGRDRTFDNRGYRSGCFRTPLDGGSWNK